MRISVDTPGLARRSRPPIEHAEMTADLTVPYDHRQREKRRPIRFHFHDAIILSGCHQIAFHRPLIDQRAFRRHFGRTSAREYSSAERGSKGSNLNKGCGAA
jgi:hypothetical protein